MMQSNPVEQEAGVNGR